MLIRFCVENFRSFVEPQVFMMSANKALRRRKEENTFPTDLPEKDAPILLRTAAIFGPNASGKSNLIKAFSFIQELVVSSAKAGPDDQIDVQPFRLDPAFINKDSRFEIDFVEEGVRYQFGITVNEKRITSEWLIAYPKARAQLYYERKFDPELLKDEYTFGANLEGGRLRTDWARQTGPNALYLSRAVQNSAEEFSQLKKPYHWFRYRLRVLDTSAKLTNNKFTLKMCQGEHKNKILEFMNSADVPIADLDIQQTPIDLDALSGTLSESFIKKLLSDNTLNKNTLEPRFFHRSVGGDLYEFKENEESDGTRALFAFSGPWRDVLDNNLVLIVDELDTSLHPMIVHRLIEMLNSAGQKAQLIFTTHDTSIMSTRILRRDQYWFTQRDSRGASKLYSLHDFKGREEDAIQDRYFDGGYGALPILRSLWRNG